MNYMDMYNKSNIRNPRYTASAPRHLSIIQKHLEMSAIWFPILEMKRRVASQSFGKYFGNMFFFQIVVCHIVPKYWKKHLPVSPSAFARDRGSTIREEGPFMSLSASMLKGHRDGPGVHFSSFLLSQNHPPKLAKGGKGKKHRGEKQLFKDRVSRIQWDFLSKIWWSWVTSPPIGPKQFCTTWLSRHMVCNII